MKIIRISVNDLSPRAVGVFASRLAERGNIPELRAKEMSSWTDDEVRNQLSITATVLKRFATAVADAVVDPDSTNDFLHDLDLRWISRDHDWRAIFAALRAHEVGAESYNFVAIRAYLQYLHSRHELVSEVQRARRSLEDTDDYGEIPQQIVPQPVDYVRLPNGQPKRVAIPYRNILRMRLGRHPFHIQDGCPPRLVDPVGHETPLRKGKQFVGRHPESDIVVSRDFSDVSRAHAVVEWDGGESLRITDLSTRGTLVESGSVSGDP